MKLRYVFNKTDYPNGSKISFPVGIKRCKMVGVSGQVNLGEIGGIAPAYINTTQDIIFPTINNRSPCEFSVSWSDSGQQLQVFIEEIGGIPDPNYFADTAPITEGGDTDGGTN